MLIAIEAPPSSESSIDLEIRLSAAAFEDKPRRCSSKTLRLADHQTVSQYLRNLPGDDPVGLTEDFDEIFDQWRREGEILLLIVGDEITKSAEKLVGWMAKAGSTPYKLG